MPELERDRLKALCEKFPTAAFVDELRNALESAEKGLSGKPMPTHHILSLYSHHASMNEKRQSPLLGFPGLLTALESTVLKEIVISWVVFQGYNFIVFTDTDYSTLLGVLRGAVVPPPTFDPPDEMAQYARKNDLVNIARLLDEGWDIEKVDI